MWVWSPCFKVWDLVKQARLEWSLKWPDMTHSVGCSNTWYVSDLDEWEPLILSLVPVWLSCFRGILSAPAGRLPPGAAAEADDSGGTGPHHRLWPAYGLSVLLAPPAFHPCPDQASTGSAAAGDWPSAIVKSAATWIIVIIINHQCINLGGEWYRLAHWTC